MSDGIFIFIAFAVLSIAILFLWSVVWGYKDAVKRGKSGIAVATLIALFPWPFGFIIWSFIRPDAFIKSQKITSKDQKPTIKETNVVTNSFITSFKEMPLVVKFFCLFSGYLLIDSLLNLVQMKPIQFGYFGTEFPKNRPFLWYGYIVLLHAFAIAVYFKISYSLLKKVFICKHGFIYSRGAQCCLFSNKSSC